MQIKKQQKNWTWNNRLVPNWEGSTSRLYIVTLLIKLICRVHHAKWRGGVLKTSINFSGRYINNFRYADDTALIAESKEELNSFLMKVKDESEKAGLNLNIQKTKIMASGPIASWQTDGETMETVIAFIFLGSKSTAYGDCSHELKDTCSLEEKL